MTNDSRAMTVRWVLQGGADDGAGPLVTEHLGRDLAQTVDGVSERMGAVVGRQLAAVAAGLADMDLLDVLCGAWRKERALVTAARSTLAHPGSEEIVDLANHRVESSHHPAVDVMVDGVTVATVEVEILLAVTLRAVVATVRAGRIVALDGGRCVASARMSVEGQQIAEGIREFDTPALRVSLGRGLALLAADDDAERRGAGRVDR
jgi:hypothetical protein